MRIERRKVDGTINVTSKKIDVDDPGDFAEHWVARLTLSSDYVGLVRTFLSLPEIDDLITVLSYYKKVWEDAQE